MNDLKIEMPIESQLLYLKSDYANLENNHKELLEDYRQLKEKHDRLLKMTITISNYLSYTLEKEK